MELSNILVILIAISPLGQCFTEQMMRDKKCIGKDINFTDDDVKTIGNCVGEVAGPEAAEGSKPISQEKRTCVGKCVMTKMGLIDAQGQISKDAFLQKLNTMMPPEVSTDMTTAIGKCVGEKGKGLDPNDSVSCQSYQPFLDCVGNSMMQVCRINP